MTYGQFAIAGMILGLLGFTAGWFLAYGHGRVDGYLEASRKHYDLGFKDGYATRRDAE